MEIIHYFFFGVMWKCSMWLTILICNHKITVYTEKFIIMGCFQCCHRFEFDLFQYVTYLLSLYCVSLSLSFLYVCGITLYINPILIIYIIVKERKRERAWWLWQGFMWSGSWWRIIHFGYEFIFCSVLLCSVPNIFYFTTLFNNFQFSFILMEKPFTLRLLSVVLFTFISIDIYYFDFRPQKHVWKFNQSECIKCCFLCCNWKYCGVLT